MWEESLSFWLMFSLLNMGSTSFPPVRVGNNMTLQCSFQVPFGNDLRIHWHHYLNGRRAIVHSYYNGTEQLKDQDEAFHGRTKLSLPGIQQGDASLTLTDLRLSDRGDYRCIIVNGGNFKSSNISLQVSAPYERPQVRILSRIGENVTVECSSQGGVSEALMVWRDEEGNTLEALETPVVVRNKQEICEVRSKLTVTVERDIAVCCCLTPEPRAEELRVCDTIAASQKQEAPTLLDPKNIIAISILTLVGVSACWAVVRRQRPPQPESSPAPATISLLPDGPAGITISSSPYQ
ncbi:CD276 antigen-like isoform X1 [Ornithorhynchus anatinus]|uniref:Ig-like domain-containing protein n=1 Tax=Ornithorhynchus anatinus TaxID=9258 RepID=A0A6I8N007_ORNAN|nr:CD276 antigen-like isoform X1 [Ornithorhynchus anatinus]